MTAQELIDALESAINTKGLSPDANVVFFAGDSEIRVYDVAVISGRKVELS